MKHRLLCVLPLALAMLFAFQADGCDHTPTSDQIQNKQQEKLTQEAVSETGIPGITHFTEKKIVKTLYELRDQNIGTFSYVTDMQGNLHHVCDSIGYGLPYGVQFTNPLKPLYGGYHDSAMIPQSEPNGLFMPPSAEGTWVICADPTNKNSIKPIYVEPRVVVSPFRLNSISDWAKGGN